MKIGNIVSDNPLNLGKEFNNVKSLDDIIQGLPTLIVGHSIVKSTFGEDLDFMSREINGINWTFTKEEYKKYYILDTEEFYEKCFIESVNKLKYIFVDPIQSSKGKIKKIISKIKTLKNPISYITETNMLYLYDDNLIFGIDLKLIKYIGINDDKIKSRIMSISSVFLEGEEILIEYKNYLERLKNQPKYVPFLYSIKNNE